MPTSSKSEKPETRVLRTAVERREELLTAAAREFGRRGFYGTPTAGIAAAAGISHPYLFRLFPTKMELFVACLQRAHEEMCDVFRVAGAAYADDPPAALYAMGCAYDRLLEERPELLRLHLHGQAACQEPAIADAVSAGLRSVVDTVTEISGADEHAVRDFIATGMLLNTLGAVNIGRECPEWMAALRKG